MLINFSFHGLKPWLHDPASSILPAEAKLELAPFCSKPPEFNGAERLEFILYINLT